MESVETNVVFNKVFDLERFLPDSVQHPDLIERLLRHEKQDYKTSLSEQDFTELPVVSNYNPTRLTEEEILELRRINDAKLAEQEEQESENVKCIVTEMQSEEKEESDEPTGSDRVMN